MEWIELVHNLSKIIELIHSRTREKLLRTLPRDLSGVKFHFQMCNTFDDFAGMVNLRLNEIAKLAYVLQEEDYFSLAIDIRNARQHCKTIKDCNVRS